VKDKSQKAKNQVYNMIDELKVFEAIFKFFAENTLVSHVADNKYHFVYYLI
jgi:hypothetical protein